LRGLSVAMVRARGSRTLPLLAALAFFRSLCWLARPNAANKHWPRVRGSTARHAEPKRSSYETSPDWTKSVVGGLTDLVNSFGGNDVAENRTREFDAISPEQLLEGIRADFEERQYLWSGNIDTELYSEACRFTDPTISFQGLSKFESNMRNLKPVVDALIPEEMRRCVLRDIQLQDNGEVVAKWAMVGKVSLPWSPRINVGGKTRYTPGADGRIESYFEKWDIPAGEALAQLLKPTQSDEVDHWPDQLLGAPPPKPSRVAPASVPAVLLPGFGNDAIDYAEPLGQDTDVGLQACLSRRGVQASTVPVQRSDWLKVFAGLLLDPDSRAGNGTAETAYGWYLDLAKDKVEETVQAAGQPVILIGHSAGGWLARALLQREGKEWAIQHVQGLVSLGTPHKPPPKGKMDMTFGCLRNLNKAHPGAYFADHLFYVSVAGDAVTGQKMEGNIPIVELIQSPSPESTAWNSYVALGGVGNATGDGLVPVDWAHLPGAEQVTLEGCLHSINVAGTTRPTNRSYLCEYFVDEWVEKVLDSVREGVPEVPEAAIR
ncbi:unnamed protein product, partial [Symbiodinium pilosum]